jgi:hypothetical protein
LFNSGQNVLQALAGALEVPLHPLAKSTCVMVEATVIVTVTVETVTATAIAPLVENIENETGARTGNVNARGQSMSVVNEISARGPVLLGEVLNAKGLVMIGHPARKGPVRIENEANVWREESILVVLLVVEIGGGRTYIESARGMSKWCLLSGGAQRRPRRACMKTGDTKRR